MKGFSIILPTLHRSDFLLNTVKDLMRQKFHYNFEIIVVDQSDQADEAIETLANANQIIKYHHIITFKGLPEARNYGASHSNYDYLLYLDDDISCKSNLLEEHFKYLQNETIDLVAGGITEKYNQNKDSVTGKFDNYTATPLRGFHIPGKKNVDHAGGGNFSIKKTVFNNLGGFDENLTKGAALYEETDFCMRLKRKGHSIFYNHDAHVFHLAAATGGCRVTDIENYIFALSRNRIIIIQRYLSLFYKITAHAYLFKLIVSYVIAYKNLKIFKSYLQGQKEGKLTANKAPLRTV